VTVVVLAGLGVGFGIVGIVVALRRPEHSLSSVLAAPEREMSWPRGQNGPLMSTPMRHESFWRLDRFAVERAATALKERSPQSLKARLDSSLNVTGDSLEHVCSQAFCAAVVGFLLPAVCWAVVTASGIDVSFLVPIWACVVLAAGGAVLPFAVLSADAKRCRRAARRAIGNYLDLVVLCLAGGMGVEGGLHAAAQVGDDSVSARIVGALTLARDAGDPPWNALAALGDELGVSELPELASAVGLAGTHGARIRSTLAAKAASIRRHELAESEAVANAVTERLFLPGVLLLIGFLIFIGYPAVARIASGL